MNLLKDKIWVKLGSANVGVAKIEEITYVIDTGSSTKFAKELLSEMDNGKKVVLNTHSHADHIQGNYLFEKNGAKIYANELEITLIRNPSFETLYLYGASPPKALRSSFYKAKPSHAVSFDKLNLIPKIDLISLPGHSPGMTAVKIDGVIFCGDAYFGANVLEKYSYPYLVDVKKFLNSLDTLEKLNADLYVPSHGVITSDPHSDIERTRAAVHNFVNAALESLKGPEYVETLCAKVSKKMSISLNAGTFYLFRSFMSSILEFLEKMGKVKNSEVAGMWEKI